MYVCLCLYVCVCMYLYVCMYVCMCVCVCVCVCVRKVIRHGCVHKSESRPLIFFRLNFAYFSVSTQLTNHVHFITHRFRQAQVIANHLLLIYGV